jgi:hypothetical protein
MAGSCKQQSAKIVQANTENHVADKKDGKSAWAIDDGLLTGPVLTIANNRSFGQCLVGMPAYDICPKYPLLIGAAAAVKQQYSHPGVSSVSHWRVQV